MSLESALEEERLEILKLLEQPRKTAPAPSSFSTPSSPRTGFASLARTASPQRQVSSLIDAVETVRRPGPKSEPSGTPDSGSPTAYRSPPPLITDEQNAHHRTRSDASRNEAPRLLGKGSMSQPATPYDQYSFSMTPSVAGPGLPKRASMTAMNKRSKSPLPPQLGMHRASSPLSSQHVGRLNSPPPIPEGRVITSSSGKAIDLDHAYARLTDDALAQSSPSFWGNLPERKTSLGEHSRTMSGDSMGGEGVRLQKDVLDPDNETAVADSTDEEDSDISLSSDEDEESVRGRKGRPSPLSMVNIDPGSRDSSVDRRPKSKSMLSIGSDPGGGKRRQKKGGIDATKGTAYTPRRRNYSLLAAADEERKKVSLKYKSLLDIPKISLNSGNTSQPGGNSPTTARRSGVHPSTNFDDASQINTPVSSDVEQDEVDLKRAQRMDLSISKIITHPESNRVYRTLFRGDYRQIADEVEKGRRRSRKYLVAMDMSDESKYAMEWTIGTVLRDGDVLLCMYAIDQEATDDGKKTPDSTIVAMASQAFEGSLAQFGSMNGHPTTGTSSPLRKGNSNEQSRERTKGEQERFVAAEALTQVVTKLLKKTRLQVKVVIEVIHCKSPKHLITEMIDVIGPTLVVLGSRGRSALKGVLLGSFSNYLVTKSSVPVMVARKKLKHTKKKPNVRLSNNLQSNTQRILANAKVD